jgi:hypothetical protein
VAKEKRPSWFKLYNAQKGIIDAFSDVDVGRAIKALMLYFSDEEEPDLDGNAKYLFTALRLNVDEARNEYRKAVEAGKKGAEIRSAQAGRNAPTEGQNM